MDIARLEVQPNDVLIISTDQILDKDTLGYSRL